MNPQLKGHIVARLDKVHDGTAHIFSDKFFESLTFINYYHKMLNNNSNNINNLKELWLMH